MKERIAAFIVCPICKGSLFAHSTATPPELICPSCEMAYPIHQDVPVMMEEKARSLSHEEAQKWRQKRAQVTPTERA